MKNEKLVLLPGLDKQVIFLLEKENVEGLKILVIGSSSELVALQLAEISKTKVEVIVEEYDSFINSRLLLESSDEVNVKVMDFEVTDFKNESFDLVYAQASITSLRRNKIIKEIKRLLKPEGILCVGEIVKLEKQLPNFISIMFETADLDPMFKGDLNEYYLGRNFVINESKNLTHHLFEYYKLGRTKLKETEKGLTENEKSYYKKLLKKTSHETNVFLKQGAERYVGFQALIMRKK
jgi:SAM-dependent methyltransferase